jgi:hypothetical protein
LSSKRRCAHVWGDMGPHGVLWVLTFCCSWYMGTLVHMGGLGVLMLP